MIQLEERESFSEGACIESLELARLESAIEFANGVLSEFVVEGEVPTETVHLNFSIISMAY